LRLAAALVDLAGELNLVGATFAVVGGLAASARGEARFTRDIDVVVAISTDEEAEALVFQLTQRGYLVLATVEHDAIHRLATARLKHPSGVVCDLIFATCGIEREIVDGAQALELFDAKLIPTASAEAVIAMKVLSVTDQRPRDLGDIQAILRANPDLDQALVLTLLGAISGRGFARGQNLIEKWSEIRSRLES
jgi:hypothetical protein